ncbi:extracellular solute-binding protein [Micromonospora sp. RHAY321]|uniref:extracellular solute-binding protein n=1 Tax=Micromonospora sp. RHAY321 TaxID=2944807 RepID=UPI00207C7EBF|nr:extracellular solute-binding protein [Micromonospora sp. RHAY321]MCO1597533.1 extracellular solute-binding protein [Micromonospora sp. RHAY321]
MKKTDIDVWVADLRFPGWMDRWHQQAAEFSRLHPEYEVVVRGMDFFTFPQVLAEEAAQGRRPALAEYYFYASQVARDTVAADGSPLFTSVSKAIGDRTEILGEPVVLHDLHPAFRDYYTYDGDLESMPSAGTTSLLFANRDLLDRAGVSGLPQTWDEVTAVCERVARLDGGPSHAITWSNHGTFVQQALACQGGHFVNNRNGRDGRATKIDLTSKEMMSWVNWWQKLHQDGHYLYTGEIPDWAGTLEAFRDQRVAIRISSSNDVNYMALAAEMGGFTMDVGAFPHNDDVPYVGNAVAGTSIWLANGLDEVTQEGALAFLMWLHNPRNAAQRHKDNSFVPITRASYELLAEEGWFDTHPHHSITYDHVNDFPAGVSARPAGGRPLTEGALFGDFAGAQDIMTHAMHDVLTHGADPLARFTQATAEAQKLLDDYNAWVSRVPRDVANIPNSSHRVEFWTDAKPYTAQDLEDVVPLNS